MLPFGRSSLLSGLPGLSPKCPKAQHTHGLDTVRDHEFRRCLRLEEHDAVHHFGMRCLIRGSKPLSQDSVCAYEFLAKWNCFFFQAPVYWMTKGESKRNHRLGPLKIFEDGTNVQHLVLERVYVDIYVSYHGAFLQCDWPPGYFVALN
jgi:hypothetical protein